MFKVISLKLYKTFQIVEISRLFKFLNYQANVANVNQKFGVIIRPKLVKVHTHQQAQSYKMFKTIKITMLL